MACLWQAFPDKTNREIKDLIIKSSDRYTVPDNQYGYGIPDFGLAMSTGLGSDDFSKKGVFLYPNPVDDWSTISFSDNFDTAVFCVYSILGQKIFEQPITKKWPSVSLKSLQSGMYIYRINWKDSTSWGKFIKQ